MVPLLVLVLALVLAGKQRQQVKRKETTMRLQRQLEQKIWWQSERHQSHLAGTCA